jgi:hypothetical protein
MTAQEFIFDSPLYTKIAISEDDQLLLDLSSYGLRIDGYNPYIGVDSTFLLVAGLDSQYLYQEDLRVIRFECQRYKDYLYVYIHYNLNEGFIEKVGQYPSVATIHIAQIKKYSKVLDKPYLKDLARAIGLAANGIGTGSYVYLRRIFEHLIDEISRSAIESGEIDANLFNSCKMDKKMKMLENHLPDVMIDNKLLYGVLSKGIHELSEEDCLKYFTVVRQIIELILDEWEYERQKVQKKKDARTKLSVIASEIK